MTSPANSFEVFVQAARRFLFFTGQGGVRKTSLSFATAVALADRGRRVVRDTLGSHREESCRTGCGN